MADSTTRRLSSKALQSDKDAYAAFDDITGYAPANTDYSAAKLSAAETAMEAAIKAEVKAAAAFAAARDTACAAEWEFHNLVLGMKDQVRAQFGPNSNQWQALGQVKKSEFKRPTPKSNSKPAA